MLGIYSFVLAILNEHKLLLGRASLFTLRSINTTLIKQHERYKLICYVSKRFHKMAARWRHLSSRWSIFPSLLRSHIIKNIMVQIGSLPMREHMRLYSNSWVGRRWGDLTAFDRSDSNCGCVQPIDDVCRRSTVTRYTANGSGRKKMPPFNRYASDKWAIV